MLKKERKTQDPPSVGSLLKGLSVLSTAETRGLPSMPGWQGPITRPSPAVFPDTLTGNQTGWKKSSQDFNCHFNMG